MGKLIGSAGEAAKVKVRQARKGAVDGIKDIPSEDEQKRAEKHVSHALYHTCISNSICKSCAAVSAFIVCVSVAA